MRTAAYIGKLTGTGMDPRTAQVHGEAIEDLRGEEFVTREHFDASMVSVDARFEKLEASIDRAKAELETKIHELHNASLKWTLGTCFIMVGLIYSTARFVK
jgi:hypothetical protein